MLPPERHLGCRRPSAVISSFEGISNMSSHAAAPRTLNDLGTVIETNARRSPERVAVKEAWSGRSRSYAELDDRTTRLANALLGLGMQTGDRIAAWMDDVIEYPEVYVAAAKAGLV